MKLKALGWSSVQYRKYEIHTQMEIKVTIWWTLINRRLNAGRKYVRLSRNVTACDGLLIRNDDGIGQSLVSFIHHECLNWLNYSWASATCARFQCWFVFKTVNATLSKRTFRGVLNRKTNHERFILYYTWHVPGRDYSPITRTLVDVFATEVRPISLRH
jgi:hypothetical protein